MYYEVRLPALANMTAKQEDGTNTEAGALNWVLVHLPSLKIPDPQHLCIPKRHRVKFGVLGALCYDALPPGANPKRRTADEPDREVRGVGRLPDDPPQPPGGHERRL